jgi:hypothetical protein
MTKRLARGALVAIVLGGSGFHSCYSQEQKTVVITGMYNADGTPTSDPSVLKKMEDALRSFDVVKPGDIVEVLDTVKAGKDDNRTTPTFSRLVTVYTAARDGQLDYLRLLAQNPAFDAAKAGKDDNGMNPLHYAIENGHLDVVKYLVETGADINDLDGKGRTPLSIAENSASPGAAGVADFLRSIRKGLLDVASSSAVTNLTQQKVTFNAVQKFSSGKLIFMVRIGDLTHFVSLGDNMRGWEVRAYEPGLPTPESSSHPLSVSIPVLVLQSGTNTLRIRKGDSALVLVTAPPK